jgi:ABC-type antimicrobial peptide transport system permease subunit
MLFGPSQDPLTYFVFIAVVILAAAAACYFPMRNALRTDPTVALRRE